MTTDYIEDTPSVIGRCSINVGGNKRSGCGRLILDSDPDAVPLGKDGVICGNCYHALFSAASRSSQVNLGRPKEDKAFRDPRRADSLAGGAKRKRHAKSVDIRLPGSKDFKGDPKRKQPWGMEKP